MITQEMLANLTPEARETVLSLLANGAQTAQEIAVSVKVESYTPKRKGSKPGVFLKTQVGKGKELWLRLNDGDKLNDQGRDALRKISEGIAAHI